jgi:hypothetical protein
MTYIDRALEDVRRELFAVELATIWHATDIEISFSPLDIYHREVGFAFGWFQGGRMTIPRWNTSLQRWYEKNLGPGVAVSLRDVLRHEFGHAVRFFLGEMCSTRRPWTGVQVSTDYANSLEDRGDRAEEDFAECFMLYLKLGGRFVSGKTWRVTPAKWKAVQKTIARASRLKTSIRIDCPHCGRLVQVDGPPFAVTCPYASCRQDFTIT